MYYTKIILLSFVFVGLLSADLNPHFQKEFDSELRSANEKYNEIKNEINNISLEFGNDPIFISAIVFPEIVRYSMFKDFLETRVLEHYYVKDGAKSANFSIGIFQMKPSFVEQLEVEVSVNTSLSKYRHMIQYESDDKKEIRQERLLRMQNLSWQITYINCFCNIVENKFKSIKFYSSQQRLKFYASAYNHGYNCSSSEIFKWINIKSYPHGFGLLESKYCYSNVAVYFYNQHN